MDAVARIESNAERRDSEIEVNAILAMLCKLFPTFTAEQAEAWRPLFKAELVGTGTRPTFSAHQIREGAVKVLGAWRRRDAPKPGDFSTAATGVAMEHRERQKAEHPHPQPQNAICRACGGHGSLNLYKPVGDTWVKLPWLCDHSQASREAIRKQGWQSFIELKPHERIQIYPAAATKTGTVGAAINRALSA